jgi:uncharacterized protein YdhG (YjbR/CyaY superfamily)
VATTTKKAAPSRTSTSAQKFTAEERSAMKARAAELKAAANADAAAKLVDEAIAKMPPADRVLAEKIHAIIGTVAPELTARTWYGMPAYAKDGDVICFFQSGAKFKTRYATFGFSDKAKLDDGAMWPNSYALLKPTPADLANIVALVKRAVG